MKLSTLSYQIVGLSILALSLSGCLSQSDCDTAENQSNAAQAASAQAQYRVVNEQGIAYADGRPDCAQLGY